MMGRIADMWKRWWKFALVITLALSLTSCSTKAPLVSGTNYGFGYCDDQNWVTSQGVSGPVSYDVYVIPMGTGTYQLAIIPIQVNAGDLIKITLTNNQATG